MPRVSFEHTAVTRNLCLAAAVAALLGHGAPSCAQDDGDTADTVLKAVQVKAAADHYTAKTVHGARLDTPLLETPRAIGVIPQQLILDQQPNDEVELMRNVSGISTYSSYGGSYSSFTLRGLWANNGSSYLRDGARWMHLVEPMLFNIEQIEVIKGPNAIDYGLSTPGGFINYVTKKPQAQTRRSLRVGIGSDALRRAEIDLTGAVDKAHNVLYRLTGGYERGGDFTDHIDPERKGLAASLAWSIAPDAQLNLSAERNEIDLAMNPGLAVPEPGNIHSADHLSASNFYGDTAAQFNGRVSTVSAELIQALSEHWSTRLFWSRTKTIRSNPYVSLTGVSGDGTRVNRILYWAPRQAATNDTALAEVRGDFGTGALRHQLLAGLDYRSMGQNNNGYIITALPSLSVDDPDSNSPLPAWTGTSNYSDARNLGLFVQDSIDFGNRWGAQLGLRRDRLHDDKVTPAQDFAKTSPSAALTFKPLPTAMLYLSYASSFEPNSGVLVYGDDYADPSVGKQWELGGKSSWLGGRLETTAALFELRKTNVATTDPLHSGYAVLTGEVRVRGLELEARGQPVQGLQINAQASFLNPEITDDSNAAVVGNQPLKTVKQNWSLWATYRLPGAWSHWRVGGGLFHSGAIAVDNANTLEIPGHTTADAMVGWDVTRRLSLALNVYNITDKRYYVDAQGGAGQFTTAYPGQPRSFRVSADFSF